MLIRNGNMVKIKGINGFGFVKEIIWCASSKKCVMSVSVTLHDYLREAQDVIVDPDDVSLFHSKPSKATRIYATADDHKHAALMMQDERLAV